MIQDGKGHDVIKDSELNIVNSAAPTKKVDFDVSDITTGNTRTINVPDRDIGIGSGSAFSEYDAIVCSSGDADYTSIATALSTEGANKSILVKRGTYNETAAPTTQDGQMIHFDDVIINIATGYNFRSYGDYVTLSGIVTIAGPGDTASNNQLLRTTATSCDAYCCRITLEPDYTSSTGAISITCFSFQFLSLSNTASVVISIFRLTLLTTGG